MVEAVCRLHDDFDFWRATANEGLEVVKKRASQQTYTPVLMHALSSAMLGLEQSRAQNTLQKRVWDQFAALR